MSDRWPRTQAWTKRTGIAGTFFPSTSYRPFVRLSRWTSGRFFFFTCTTNHSGNWNAGTPVSGLPLVVVGDRRPLQRHRLRAIQHGRDLRREPLLDDRRHLRLGKPVVEPADDDRVIRQVDHRAGTVGPDELAPADLPLVLLHASASSVSGTALLSRRLRTRPTLGSTSLIARWARNFLISG